jgi:hypothetical protein
LQMNQTSSGRSDGDALRFTKSPPSSPTQ